MRWLKIVVGVSLAVSLTSITARHWGIWQNWELGVFDYMMRSRPDLPQDDRLLIVQITETDIQNLQKWPFSDAILTQLLTKISKYQPLAIGLDIYRDIPNPPGYEQLQQQFKQNSRLIAICKVSDSNRPEIPPPATIPLERVGFADLLVDSNLIVRRGLLFLETDGETKCKTPFSLGFQLAQRYLATKGIIPETIRENYVQLGKALFQPLSPDAGGYQNAERGGYQILLNYRSANAIAPKLTLDDILKEHFDPQQIKDKIVLIGVTANSVDDAFNTPYSMGQKDGQKMPGVEIHAQLVSQIISAALGERQLFWFWAEWAEILWIILWAIAGSTINYTIRNPLYLISLNIAGFSLILGISWGAFLQTGWIPMIPSVIAFILSSTIATACSAYYTQKDQLGIIAQIEQQNQDLALLKSLIQEQQQQITLANAPTIVNSQTLPDEPTSLLNSPEISEFPNVTMPLLGGRYRILNILGSGGFAYTYLAEDTQRPGYPQCLVKHLQPARRDPYFMNIARRLFNKEAEILEIVGNHAQIPYLLAHFEDHQQFYLVEEYIPGNILSEELKLKGKWSETDAIAFLQEMLPILSYIHKKGIIHRDLKPSNLIRSSKTGNLVLIDFGAVKQIQAPELTQKSDLTVAIGTKGYTPPEQYAGQPNFSSDIYALGMIAIQGLTGVAPGDLTTDLETGEICWHHLLPEITPLTTIIAQMVRYHFKDRYPSADAVLKDLGKLKL